MDDIAYLINCMIGTQKRVKIRVLDVPVLSGPTSGVSFTNELYEWYIQNRRWGIGTSDIFHYYIVKLGRLPFVTIFSFGFSYFLYYGCMLCASSIFTLTTLAYPSICPSTAIDWLPKFGDFEVTPTRAFLLLAAFQYAMFGMVYILDAIWIRVVLNIQEDISLLRNVFHWLMTGPTILAYSLVQLYSFWLVVWKGKSACAHGILAADKTALIGNQSTVAVPYNPARRGSFAMPYDENLIFTRQRAKRLVKS